MIRSNLHRQSDYRFISTEMNAPVYAIDALPLGNDINAKWDGTSCGT